MTRSVLRTIAAAALLAPAGARAGPPFRTDDPVPVDYQHFEINLFSQGTAIAGGWGGFLPGLEVNYGALPNLQLHVIVQQGYVAPNNGRFGLALGDVELGAKYRLVMPADDDWFPQLGVFPTIELPVGNPRVGLYARNTQIFGFNTRHAQVYLPIWLEKDWGNWSLYGGGGGWLNPGAGNDNYAFLGVALWRRVLAALSVGAEIFHQTTAGQGAPAGTGFNLGVVYDVSDTWHVLASAGSGVQNTTATNRLSYYSAIQLTF